LFAVKAALAFDEFAQMLAHIIAAKIGDLICLAFETRPGIARHPSKAVKATSRPEEASVAPVMTG
jgi:hypothetical protein